MIRVNMNLPRTRFGEFFVLIDLATLVTNKQSQNLKFEQLLPGGFYSVDVIYPTWSIWECIDLGVFILRFTAGSGCAPHRRRSIKCLGGDNEQIPCQVIQAVTFDLLVGGHLANL